jgi:rhodanese-related sulfurtransferase
MPVPALRTNEAGAVIVTQEEVVRMIAAGTAPTILDVRTPEEFAEGHVPGAINISHDQLADRLAEIEASKEDEVIVYCRSGRRAGIAEQLLLDQGFRNVQHLEGDMLAWLEANRPTEKQQ